MLMKNLKNNFKGVNFLFIKKTMQKQKRNNKNKNNFY